MLTFTAANWATNQTVRVSAAEDDADHLDEMATISHTVTSTDTTTAGSVRATSRHGDGRRGGAGRGQLRSATYTVDEGDTVDVTVTLNRDPERTVVISITKTNQGGAVNGDYRGVPSSVTFNSGGDTGADIHGHREAGRRQRRRRVGQADVRHAARCGHGQRGHRDDDRDHGRRRPAGHGQLQGVVLPRDRGRERRGHGDAQRRPGA